MCYHWISSCKSSELGISVIVRQGNLLYVQHDFLSRGNLLYVQHDFLSRVRDRAYLYRSNFLICMSMKCPTNAVSLPMIVYEDHLYLLSLFRFIFHFDSSSISAQFPFGTFGPLYCEICFRATLLKFTWDSSLVITFSVGNYDWHTHS